ncbi:MAG: transglutaminase domain-containing protein [Calditrichota bacterium]
MKTRFLLLFAAMLITIGGRAVELSPNQSPAFKVLAEVLQHYSADTDSLKRAAARFLVDNMEGHGYITYDLVDSAGQVISFSIFDYADYDQLTASFDSLEDRYGVLDFRKREMIADDSVITANFLIEHIDDAFTAWNKRAWASWLTFDQVCEFVLPYRGSNEPLEQWRLHFNQRYDSSFQHMTDPRDPVEAASIINQDLMTWFRFDPRYYYHPTDQGLSEMESTHLGRCEDMTNLTIYAMRANGLAVTSDYTPYWANSGNNHAWNAILTFDGKVIPFMGAEANPGGYRLANKLAKVYRKTYSIQRNNLAFQADDSQQLPGYLASKCYIDVTRDYVPTRTLTLPVEVPDSMAIAYLCVFNSGEWQPIQWGTITGDSVRFVDMGIDIAYLPGIYVERKIIPVGPPFILEVDGSIEPLTADTNRRTTLRLTSTTATKQESSTDGIIKTNLAAGTRYELHYWDNDWQIAAQAVAAGEPLIFTAIPAHCLYWLTAENSDHEERIFTFANERQVWW